MKSIILLLGISLFSVLAFGQDPCASVNINGGNGQITVTGVSGAPIVGVQVFNSSWASVFNQTYTNPNGAITVPSLTPGQYFVNVRLYTSNWAVTCEKGANATVSNSPPPPPDSCFTTFQKTFGRAPGNDVAYSITKIFDGNYIVIGQSAASGNTNEDALIMKFNKDGGLLWSKTLGGAQTDFLSAITATTDGGFIAAGATNANGIGTYTGDVWVVRFDAAGNIVWQKRYFVSGTSSSMNTIIQTSDGGFALTGTFPNTPGVSEWMLLKIDANGNLQWQKKVGTGNSDSGIGLIEDDHGGAGLVVSGIVYSGTYYDAVLTKFDMSGNVVWTRRWDFDSRTNWPKHIYKVSDGFVINTLNNDGWEPDNARPAILKTDFNGNLLWIKEYVIPNCREAMMTVLPDGGFMMVQSELPHDAASDMHLMRIDAAGNIIWTKKYPRTGAEWLWNLISDGNHVVGAGFATAGSYNDVLLSKVDLNGKLGSCSSQNVTATPRNPVVSVMSFAWPTNGTHSLTAANTTYTPVTINPTENVLCVESCPPPVTIGNVTVNESAGNVVLQVCITAPAANTLVYNYTTANGTATSGSDYTGGAGTVTIQAGQTCGTITIPILNDATTEQSENFTVSIGSTTGTVTINDDDQAQYDCNAVTITPASNLITVTGVTAPVATVQVFNSNWASVFNQTYTNSPGTVNVPIGPGTYLVKVTFYNSNWGYICDKSVNVTVVNQCPAGTICISNICPAQTVDLNAAYSIPNLPAGTTVSWHTGTPATDANRMTPQEAQSVSASGTYYAAINISGAGCYSATIAVNVTITPCSGGVSAKMNAVQVTSEDMPAARNIVVFPNPFTRSLRVIIDSEKNEKASLTLMDVQGRPVKQIPVQLMPGSNTVLMEGLEKFPAGNYFLRINSASGMKTLKLMRQQ